MKKIEDYFTPSSRDFLPGRALDISDVAGVAFDVDYAKIINDNIDGKTLNVPALRRQMMAAHFADVPHYVDRLLLNNAVLLSQLVNRYGKVDIPEAREALMRGISEDIPDLVERQVADTVQYLESHGFVPCGIEQEIVVTDEVRSVLRMVGGSALVAAVEDQIASGEVSAALKALFELVHKSIRLDKQIAAYDEILAGEMSVPPDLVGLQWPASREDDAGKRLLGSY